MNTKTSNDSEMMVQPIQQSNLFMTECDGYNMFEYYLTGVIEEPDKYSEVCHALRSCDENDVFVIRINSPGGRMDAGDMLINAMAECKGTTVGYIEKNCFSMATFIFLACDNWGVSENAEFMAHTCSSGSYGKEHETFEAAHFLRKQTHKRLKRDYTNFLTEEEIDKVIGGNDVYLDADEIMERLQTFSEAREELEKELAEECQGEPEPDLTEIIKESVGESVREIMKEYGMKPKGGFGNKTP